ncbi:hypothetical protein L1987_00037 [Smallanthus sonchifolius]|uniref:Uncharacterized protein n=1 Tax=Smallanthus sonchifolius TaxID=185202 RepID=A0ACB9K179_9ASTR|nr:hypothetical protein L1987_00037 [Smallanthus sonchifolius]
MDVFPEVWTLKFYASVTSLLSCLCGLSLAQGVISKENGHRTHITLPLLHAAWVKWGFPQDIDSTVLLLHATTHISSFVSSSLRHHRPDSHHAPSFLTFNMSG